MPEVVESDNEEDETLTGVKRKRGGVPTKRKPFKRKEPMKGKPRSYKIRMLFTKKQEIEVRRCFHAARSAYNFANKRVCVDGMRADTISLKKDWVRADKKLKETTVGVSSRIMNQAIKDLVQSYKSNYAKLKKKPSHKFKVKDRCEFKTPN